MRVSRGVDDPFQVLSAQTDRLVARRPRRRQITQNELIQGDVCQRLGGPRTEPTSRAIATISW